MQGVRVQAPAYKVVQSYTGQSDVGNLPLSNSGARVKENRALHRTGVPLHGAARKAALPMISLSAVGWVLFVVGFGIYKNEYLYLGSTTDYPELYWAWAASIVGPVTYILAVIHAVIWKRASAVLGSVIAFLGVVYTTALGYALIACGIFTYEASKYTGDPYYKYSHYPEYMGLMFAGSFIACFFWAITQALWPWYTTGLEHHSVKHTADSDHDHLPLIFEEETEQV